MKELKFITSKGDFLLLDGKDTITERLAELLKDYEHHAVVREMKDADFAEIVNQSIHTGLFAHYVNNIPVNTYCYKSGLESFESLVKSLGWYLWENPMQSTLPTDDINFYESDDDMELCKSKWKEAESKTFYNPILLKKI